MRLYLSGPMGEYPDHNRALFNLQAARLRAAGFEVVNPGEINHGPDATWEDCLRFDLRALLDCAGVATLPEWQCSRGACLEVHVAKELRLPVLPCAVWLKRATYGTRCQRGAELAGSADIDRHRLPSSPRRRAPGTQPLNRRADEKNGGRSNRRKEPHND